MKYADVFEIVSRTISLYSSLMSQNFNDEFIMELGSSPYRADIAAVIKDGLIRIMLLKERIVKLCSINDFLTSLNNIIPHLEDVQNGVLVALKTYI